MKLAKMDFLLRYPNCLARVLEDQGKTALAAKIPKEERDTIEAKMIRFRYGPWDSRYRKWVSLLVAKGACTTYLSGRTVNVKLTELGAKIAATLQKKLEFAELASRGKLVNTAVGTMGATALKDYIYRVIPEIVSMRWGDNIEI